MVEKFRNTMAVPFWFYLVAIEEATESNEFARAEQYIALVKEGQIDAAVLRDVTALSGHYDRMAARDVLARACARSDVDEKAGWAIACCHSRLRKKTQKRPR